MSAESDAMGDRIRPLLAPLPVVEKKMFGGIGFMFQGNMLVGTTAKGALLARVDPNRMDDALTRPGAELMQMGAKAMTGFVAVSAQALPDAASIKDWIDYSLAFLRTLPPK